jgi:hypothetical protein
MMHTTHRLDCICVGCENIRRMAMNQRSNDACSLNDLARNTASQVNARQNVRIRLEHHLETAMVALTGAVDGGGRYIMLRSAPNSVALGRLLRELAAMTDGRSVSSDCSEHASRAALARNCLLVCQALVAATALEQYERVNIGAMDASGGLWPDIVFGRATHHD